MKEHEAVSMARFEATSDLKHWLAYSDTAPDRAMMLALALVTVSAALRIEMAERERDADDARRWREHVRLVEIVEGVDLTNYED